MEGMNGLEGTSWRGWRRDADRRFPEETEEEKLPASMGLEEIAKPIQENNRNTKGTIITK